MNSLEDAYINIAREEEKLLENLNKFGMQVRRSSSKKEFEDNLNKQPLTAREARGSINEKDMSGSQSATGLSKLDTNVKEHGDVDDAQLNRYYNASKNPSICR